MSVCKMRHLEHIRSVCTAVKDKAIIRSCICSCCNIGTRSSACKQTLHCLLGTGGSPSSVSAVSVSEPETKASSASVSAADVKQLRQETGAGMMDCKRALTAANGDIQKATEV